jgi:type IV pilus assembly protein PilO
MLSRLNGLPWYFRFLIMLVVAGGVWYGFHYFVLSATAAETEQLTAKRDQLRSQNQQASVVQSRIAEFKARFEQLKAEYEQSKQLLPEAVEISRVLEHVQTLARNKLLVMNFLPEDEEQKDFYRIQPVKVDVYGTYPQLQSFFQQMAELRRVVNITEAEIKGADRQRTNRSIEAHFIVSAFYAEPEDINNLKPLPPKPVGAPGQPGAATAPQPGAPAAPGAGNMSPETTPPNKK